MFSAEKPSLEFLKIDFSGSGKPVIFWFLFISQQKQSLRPLGHCAPQSFLSLECVAFSKFHVAEKNSFQFIFRASPTEDGECLPSEQQQLYRNPSS